MDFAVCLLLHVVAPLGSAMDETVGSSPRRRHSGQDSGCSKIGSCLLWWWCLVMDDGRMGFAVHRSTSPSSRAAIPQRPPRLLG
ncbi:hypothetical protein M406DRAFT_354876 [Cryphonectria parasitica EP155]|uniref:Secreted protein n=1 Tax=Cryphonectria parasitica (strain ATCC 38755 / EP155) TaxID=660469 RepID=A0A9P4Y8C5_CRYP1|nr:uncharacterized protein M406DRAFT_354876 [Cryphonectria parasitica EP155]KAF3768284.1 hypothetical protein M406DRAFT_354876 [Cryphonectria parasitica EP155]